MNLGCIYFTYKYDSQNQLPRLKRFFESLKNKANTGNMCLGLGLCLMFAILSINKYINSRPEGIEFFFWNLLYLLIIRPMYTVGFALILLPLLLKSPGVKPLRDFMANRYWVPYSRLVYGVFLCNTIFI
mmetsp:Transcript_14995/g.23220  ORF Transcript_14995/g.23220 Transcript_14995/m.23220 type:complete len:129 (+) Transcript_14995:1493-1879(+)